MNFERAFAGLTLAVLAPATLIFVVLFTLYGG